MKIINKSIQIAIIFLVFTLLISQVQASGIMTLTDNTVTGKNNEISNHQEVNEIINEEKEDNSKSRSSFLYESADNNIVDKMKNDGFKEIVSERKKNAKTFEKNDIQKTIIFSEPIHFLKDKKLLDYNNNLKHMNTKGSLFYTNDSGDHHYFIPALLDEQSIFEVDEFSFQFKNVKSIQGEIKDDTILYKNAEEDKDYSITAMNQGIVIKSAISTKDEDLTQTYQLNLTKDMKAELDKEKSTVSLYKDNQLYAYIYVSELADADGNVVDILDNSMHLENNILTITPSEKSISMMKTSPYRIETVVKTVTSPDYSLIKFYGVRSGDKFKDKSYAPEVNPDYTYFAQVGRDPKGSINEGVVSSENVGLMKIDFQRLINDYIGEYRRIEDASISLRLATAIRNTSTLSISQLREKMPLFDNYNNLKWTQYESYYNRYKDRNQSYSPKRLDTKTITRATGTRQYFDLNITDAIDYWYQGNTAHGLIVEGDSADTEAQAIYNHSSKNTPNRLPYMTITHVNDGPIDPNISLDSTTVNLRPFTQTNTSGMLNFSALGFDGLTRPNSQVEIQVVDTTNNSVVYNQNVRASSTYRIYPLYSDIPNAQQYYRKTSNYQMPSLLLSSSLTPNHLYQVKYKVTAYDKDDHVTATKNWTNAETFQLYKVAGFDRVTRIMNFYNIQNTSQFRLDNHMFDSLLVQGNLMFIRNPRANQNNAYSSSSLNVTDKKAIDMALMGRGLHCEYGYEPVNFNTGNLYYSHQDAYFVEYGEKYYFERSYNSLSETKGILGNNWDFNWNYQLSIMDNCMVFSDGTGKLLTFFKDSNGNYQPPQGYNMTFKKNKIGEKTVYVDSGYYDEEEPPVQKAVTYNIYDYSIEDEESHKIYHFNEEGYIQDVTLDNYGHKMYYTYDHNYNINEIKTSSGKVFSLTYNANGFVTKIILPNQTAIQYQYDNQGNLITFTDQKNYKMNYAYQDIGLLKSYTSRESNNIILNNEFDSARRIIKQTNAQNQTATFEYHSDYTKVTDYKGKSQYIYLDANKRTTKVIQTDGTEKKNTYNSSNQLTSFIEDGQKTQFVYNSQGQVIEEIRSDGKKIIYQYQNNNLVKKTDYDGKSTRYEYDNYGNITKTIFSDQTYNASKYNQDGQLIYERDVYGLEKNYSYQNGNKIKETDQNQYSISYTYDALGMLSSISDQLGYKTEYIRDERGQSIKEIHPTYTKQMTYDGDGNLIYEQDGNGNGTYYRYDSLSRLIEKKNRSGIITTEYDEFDHIIKVTDQLGYSKTYTYDLSGNKTSSTDENGYTTYYKYNNQQQLIETKDVNGIVTYHFYDELGQLVKEKRLDRENNFIYNEQGKISEQSINGIKTKYEYDDYGNMIYKESRGMIEEYAYHHERMISQTIKGAKTTFAYDIYGHKTRETDALGHITYHEYSPNGNLIKMTLPNKSTFEYTYDGDHRLLSTKDSLGNITSSTYDQNGNVLTKTDENGNTIKYTYSSLNLPLSMSDSLGHVYTYNYNAKGQLIETINPLKKSKKSVLSPVGQVLKQTDELNRTIENIYNKSGQIIETKDARGRSSYNRYDDYGRLVESIDVYGKKIINTYNDYDELVQTAHEDSYIKNMFYDDRGLLRKETNEKDQTVSYEYNEHGYLIKTTDIRGNESSQTYDKLGRVVLSRDIRGIKTTYSYDEVGNLLVKENGKQKTMYEYDALSRVLKTTDSLGRTDSYQYDHVGNIIETTNAKGYITTKSYDANNNLISTTNPKNQTIKYEYDALNRLWKTVNADLSFRIHEYDEASRVISSTNELGYTSKITYNELDQEVSIKDARGHISINEYNENDLLSKIIYPDNSSMEYAYNDKNQLIKTIDTNHQTYQYVYDKYNRKTKEIAPNGYYKTYTYDQYDEVKTLSDYTGLLLNYKYNDYGDVITTLNSLKQKDIKTYDEYGQVISETDMRGNTATTEYDILRRAYKQTDVRGNITTYQYDELDRVIETKVNDIKTTQEYDEIGNVLVETDALGHATYDEYNVCNQLIKTTNPLKKSTTYTYDKLGQMLTQTDALGQTITYGYDELGNKTKEINPQGIEKIYHYNDMNLMERMQTEDKKVIEYEYDNYENVSKILFNDQVKYLIHI